jgi:hypothetical protein
LRFGITTAVKEILFTLCHLKTIFYQVKAPKAAARANRNAEGNKYNSKKKRKLLIDFMLPNLKNYLRKPFIRLVEIGLLIAFTIFVCIVFLHFTNYLWFIFTATDVGQKYAELHQEVYA